MKAAFRVGLLWCLTLVVSAAGQRVTTGVIHYPHMGNVDLREGTLECWVQLAVDTATFERTRPSANSIAVLAEMTGSQGGFGIQLLTGGIMGDGVGWYVRPAPKPLMLPVTGPAPWKLGEWHHLAVTWEGALMTAYVDGKQTSQRLNQASMAVAFGLVGELLVIGDKWNVGGRFALDELRVSIIARQPEELGWAVAGPLAVDPWTTLLDPFDGLAEVDGKPVTQPRLILNGVGGRVTAGRLVEGRYGQAISLYPEPKP